MQHNVGKVDRTIRILVGLALLGLLYLGVGPVRWFGLIGMVPLLTGAVGSCPLYQLFGFSSCPVAQSKG